MGRYLGWSVPRSTTPTTSASAASPSSSLALGPAVSPCPWSSACDPRAGPAWSWPGLGSTHMPTLSSVESESWLHTAGLGGEGAALHLTARDTRRQRTRLVLALISRAPPCHTSPGRGCLRAPAPGSAPRRVSRHTLCQTGYTALPAHTHALPAAARSRPPRRRCRARGSAALVPALPQTGGGPSRERGRVGRGCGVGTGHCCAPSQRGHGYGAVRLARKRCS